jgi:hypothetical protein
MSIIHDALKKVQAENPTAVRETFDPVKQLDRVNIPLLIAAAIAVIILAITLTFQLKNPRPEARIIKPENNAVIPTPGITHTPVPSPAPSNPSTTTLAKAVAGAVAVPSVPLPAGQWLYREPAVPRPVDPRDPLSSVLIEGVIDMGGKKAALINGNVYEEGQTIYGRVIMQIDFDSLTVIENGQKRVLNIKP